MTFYFYDLETSSGRPRSGRIMQFAGQRTNEQLEPIGEPDNILVALADDVVPEPDAVLVHGITPQKTVAEGISEAEFTEYFQAKVAQKGTVFVGYNNLRFDDEFMRYSLYRSLYDPYEWHWKDDRSRWDLLDPIRMMRALRPEGLKWPLIDGKPSVKLELMARENGIIHENAHDALSDVQALITLAQRYREHQPKLFDYLLSLRSKKAVAKLAEAGNPFVYTSGRYDSAHEKTTIVQTLAKHPRRDAAIVYDLRYDPEPWLAKSPEELAMHWRARYGDDIEKLPIKVMQYNHCPAVAPLGVLDDASRERIHYSDDFLANAAQLDDAFVGRVLEALDIVENERQTQFIVDAPAEQQMYDAFWNDQDKSELLTLRQTSPDELISVLTSVKNKRIRELVPHFKARNYPKSLSMDERTAWEAYRTKALIGSGQNGPLAKSMKRMQDISRTRTLSANDNYLLEELQLYLESIMPIPDTED